MHVTHSDSWLLPHEQIYYRGALAAMGSQSPTVRGCCPPQRWVALNLQQHPLPREVPPVLTGFIPSGNLDRMLALEVLQYELSGNIRLLLEPEHP